MSFTTVELTGTVLIAPGVYANGAMVTAVLSAPITDGTTTVEPFTVSAICDSSGAFSGLIVYANDDNTTLPVGTYYT